VPTTQWKKDYFAKRNPANTRWWPGETPSFGIGQGYTNVNALQNCVMVSRLANGKKAINPILVKSIGGVDQVSKVHVEDLPFNPDHIAFVHGAMADVVSAAGGTARGAADLDLGPIKMAGKTGTAQAVSAGGGRTAHGAVGEWSKRDHAWFVCFAPADDPKYAMAVVCEHGGFGSKGAAPKAREIMRLALLKDPDILKRIVGPVKDTFSPEELSRQEASIAAQGPVDVPVQATDVHGSPVADPTPPPDTTPPPDASAGQ
jgi:penicillin-binding protein 2